MAATDTTYLCVRTLTKPGYDMISISKQATVVDIIHVVANYFNRDPRDTKLIWGEKKRIVVTVETADDEDRMLREQYDSPIKYLSRTELYAIFKSHEQSPDENLYPLPLLRRYCHIF